MNRLTVAVPSARDTKSRPVSIPEAVLRARERKARRQDGDQDVEMEGTPGKRKTEKDLMWENGGPGIYSACYKKLYNLKNVEHKFDVIPELIDGKNIADFVDEDIMQKLEALEKEEDQLLEQARQAELENGEDSDLDEEEKQFVGAIRDKKSVVLQQHRREKNRNRSVLPSKHITRKSKEFKAALAKTGYETSLVKPKMIKTKKRMREEDTMEVDGESPKKQSRTLIKKSPHQEGLRDEEQKKMAKKLLKLGRRPLQMAGKKGTADRDITEKLPKHLFSGKRGIGKTQRR
mmetsp:Transcript_11902/g.13810  ORF Transcript_11902/g.13810 Transcript_11902/m.13810 type:complete len:290 (+) Transcript_11902:152-1021(+)